MKKYGSHIRKVALLLLLTMGLALLVVGVVQDRASFAIAGVGSWLLVLMVLLWGVRFRLGQASQATAMVQTDISKLRSSQLVMHSRMATRMRAQNGRLERIRESQLKLHSRIAEQGMSLVHQQKLLRDELRGSIERSRQAGADAQTLTLRAFREGHTEWTRVQSLIESQSKSIDVISHSLDGVVSAQQKLGNEAREELKQLSSQFTDEALARDGLHSDLKRGMSSFVSSVREEAAEVTSLARNLADELVDIKRRNTDSSKEVTQAAASVRSLVEQLSSVESTTTLLSKQLGSGVARQDELATELTAAIFHLGNELAALHSGAVVAESEQRSLLLERTNESLTKLQAGVEGIREQWLKGKAKLLSQSDKNKRELQQAMEAILQLERLSLLRTPYPLMDGWAMDPVSMLAVVRIVLEQRPQLVVECGSGTSTVWIAAALKHLGEGRIISLEHLEEYAAKTREALAAQGLEEIAEVRYTPLVEVTVGERQVPWYDPVGLADLSGVDLLLVDGPPKSTGEHARHPAVPILAHALHPGAIIIVDDCDRPDEMELITRWQDEHPGLGAISLVGPRTAVLIWPSS